MVFPGHRTFCTVLRHVDPIGDAMLRAQGGVFARLRHWAFREIHCRKVPVADAKRDALVRFGVTGRMFNGVRFDLDQAVNGWRKGLEWRVGNIKDQIEATRERIASLLRQFAKAETKSRRKAKKSAVRLKRRRLDVLKGRLDVAERELAAGRPRVCFGGGADLRRRDLARWRERRATRINIVGATGETCGNQSVHWDGTTLRVLLPAALTDPDWHEGKRYAKPRKASPEDWLVFPDVTFRYGQDELLRAVEDRRAVTWLVFLADDGRWHAHATVTDFATDVVTLGVEWGAVGLDLNVGEVAVTAVDRFGNAKRRLHLPFPVAGTPEGKARGMMGEAARAITDLCLELHLPLAREVLDFSKKKAGPARVRAGPRAAAVVVGLLEVLRPAGRALRPPGRGGRPGRPGLHVGHRDQEIRGGAGDEPPPRRGAGHRPARAGSGRTPRLPRRHPPRRSWKEPSQDGRATVGQGAVGCRGRTRRRPSGPRGRGVQWCGRGRPTRPPAPWRPEEGQPPPRRAACRSRRRAPKSGAPLPRRQTDRDTRSRETPDTQNNNGPARRPGNGSVTPSGVPSNWRAASLPDAQDTR